MEYIIVDTSSILFEFSNKIDIFKQIATQLSLKPVVSQGVLRELTKMASSTKADKKYAKVALAMINEHKVGVETDSGYVDAWILASAKKFQCVCTNDMKLKKALKAKGIQVYSVSIGGTIK